MQGEPDFGLQALELQAQVTRRLAAPYAMIMPSASRDDKLWPESDWQAVFDLLTERGLQLKLLAGNPAEANRAEALIQGRSNAEVLPRGALTETAQHLAAATLMVGLDSGLTHLSAALGRPTVGIYKASTPVRTPLVGAAFTASLGDRGQPPSRQAVIAAIEQAPRRRTPHRMRNRRRRSRRRSRRGTCRCRTPPPCLHRRDRGRSTAPTMGAV